MILEVSSATGTVQAVARLSQRQLGFLVYRSFTELSLMAFLNIPAQESNRTTYIADLSASRNNLYAWLLRL